MSARKMPLAIRIAILGGLISPIAVSSQMPSFAKLIVRSNPTGADIVINDQPTQQKTDAEFVVAAGDYTVKLYTSEPRSPNCDGKKVTLAAGETKTISCSGGKWSQ